MNNLSCTVFLVGNKKMKYSALRKCKLKAKNNPGADSYECHSLKIFPPPFVQSDARNVIVVDKDI